MVAHLGRSAVILTDGWESESLPKRFFSVGESCSLLEYVLDSVWTVSDELYIVFDRNPDLKLIEAIAPFGVKIILEDRTKTLPRMLAGIRASKSEDCLVVPGNLPFIKPSIILALFEAARLHDAAIPRWVDGRLEPLVAVYRRQSFIRVAERLNSGDVDELVGSLYAIRYVGIEAELRGLDPELLSFFRVKSKDDLSTAEKWVSAKQKT